MNLLQSIEMSKMKEQRPQRAAVKQRKATALALAKDRVLLAQSEGRAFDGQSVDEIANVLFASKTFTLMEVPLNAIASPGPRTGNVTLVRRIMAEGVHNT